MFEGSMCQWYQFYYKKVIRHPVISWQLYDLHCICSYSDNCWGAHNLGTRATFWWCSQLYRGKVHLHYTKDHGVFTAHLQDSTSSLLTTVSALNVINFHATHDCAHIWRPFGTLSPSSVTGNCNSLLWEGTHRIKEGRKGGFVPHISDQLEI